MAISMREKNQEIQGLGKSLQEVQEAQVSRAHDEEGDVGTSDIPQIRKYQQ